MPKAKNAKVDLANEQVTLLQQLQDYNQQFSEEQEQSKEAIKALRDEAIALICAYKLLFYKLAQQNDGFNDNLKSQFKIFKGHIMSQLGGYKELCEAALKTLQKGGAPKAVLSQANEAFSYLVNYYETYDKDEAQMDIIVAAHLTHQRIKNPADEITKANLEYIANGFKGRKSEPTLRKIGIALGILSLAIAAVAIAILTGGISIPLSIVPLIAVGASIGFTGAFGSYLGSRCIVASTSKDARGAIDNFSKSMDKVPEDKLDDNEKLTAYKIKGK